jgi:hypothetical protein
MTNSKSNRMTDAEARAAFIERVTDFSLPTVISARSAETAEDDDRRGEPAEDADGTKRLPTAE